MNNFWFHFPLHAEISSSNWNSACSSLRWCPCARQATFLCTFNTLAVFGETTCSRFALQIVSLSCRNYRGGGQLRMTCVDGHLWRRLRRTHTSNWLCNSQASDFKTSFDSVHFHTNWVKIRKPLIIEQHEKSKADDIWIWFSNCTILWVIMHRNHFTTTVQNNNGTVRYRDVSQEKSKSWTPNGRWVAPGYPGTQGAQGAGKDLIWVCLNISLWQFMLNSPMVTVTDVNGSKHG